MTLNEVSNWLFFDVLPDDLTPFDCIEIARKIFPYRIVPRFGYRQEPYKLWLRTIMNDMLKADMRLYEDVCYWSHVLYQQMREKLEYPTETLPVKKRAKVPSPPTNTPSKNPASQPSSRVAPQT